MAAAKKAKAKKPAEPLDPAEEAILESIRRARQVFASGSGTTLAILKEADAQLSAKLEAIANKAGAKETFTEASAVVYRKQIQVVTQYLEARMNGHTDAQARKAIAVAVKDTVTVAKALEKKFTGLTRPLALESQQMQDEAVRGTGASLLRKHQSSWKRYGATMVADFERTMRAGALSGLTHEQMVSRLVSAGKMGGVHARGLHANEPGYFPEPTSYVRKRYWAERIVRTETANAHNAGALQAMNITRNTEFPDLCKKILAVFDTRTAPDSVAVHGQIRKLEEMFVDGAGRHYLHPPARPNDRETIIPWRPHWENNATTQPAPPEVQAEAIVEAQPNPLGAERKEGLKAALAKAKEKVLAQKQAAQQQKEQAQAFELAKAKAQAAQAAGTQALGQAVLADAAVLKAAAEKVTAAALPGAKFNAAKAKAAEYLAQKEALAKAKAEAKAAEEAARAEALAKARQEKLESDAKKYAALLKDKEVVTTAKELTDSLKALAKEKPHVFAQVWADATGKPASAVLGKLGKPMTLGQAALQAAKKLQPDLDYPKPKPKTPPAPPKPPPTKAEIADAVKLELQATKSAKPAIAIFGKLTDEQVEALLEEHAPHLSAKEVEEFVKGKATKGGSVKAVLKWWDQAEQEAAAHTFEKEPVGGQTYVNVFDASKKKVAFFFEENGQYVVKPPAYVSLPQTAFSTPEAAKAYSVQVGKQVASYKAQQPTPVKPAAIDVKPPAPVAPGEMRWSPKYEAPERKLADLKSDPAKDIAKNLKATRAGHAVALDQDYIENFDVEVKLEKVAGEQQVVVRFKVTGHRSAEVLQRLTDAGAKQGQYGYRRLKDWKQDTLEFGADTEKASDGTVAKVLQHRGVSITMLQDRNRQYYPDSSELAAGHNVVELRFPGSAKDAMAKAQGAFDLMGIDTSRPSEAALVAYKRSKIMAYADVDAAKDLAKANNRLPGTIDSIWKKAVKRNPKLADIEADAEVREVGPGKLALYSSTITKQLTDAGVRWIRHDSTAPRDVIEQILVTDPQSGLLASRERYQRGLFTQGMSTSRDFETGGADSVFVRLQTTEGVKPGSYNSRWTFEIDPSEAGRLDAYVFNGDEYGKAGNIRDRLTVDKIAATTRNGNLSGSNEMMLQRQVSPGSIRRVVSNDRKERDALVKSLKEAGRDVINGIPVEEFVVYSGT